MHNLFTTTREMSKYYKQFPSSLLRMLCVTKLHSVICESWFTIWCWCNGALQASGWHWNWTNFNSSVMSVVLPASNQSYCQFIGRTSQIAFNQISVIFCDARDMMFTALASHYEPCFNLHSMMHYYKYVFPSRLIYTCICPELLSIASTGWQ